MNNDDKPNNENLEDVDHDDLPAVSSNEDNKSNDDIPSEEQDEQMCMLLDQIFNKAAEEGKTNFSTTAQWRTKLERTKLFKTFCHDPNRIIKLGSPKTMERLDSIVCCQQQDCKNSLCTVKREAVSFFDRFFSSSEMQAYFLTGFHKYSTPIREISPLYELIQEISTKHNEIEYILAGAIQSGNETRITHGTLGSKQQKQAANASKNVDSRIAKAEPNSPSLVAPLLEKCELLDIPQQQASVEDMDSFVYFLQELLATSSVPDCQYRDKKNPNAYSSKILETVEAIVNWKLEDNQNIGGLFRPHWCGQETEGVHPIINAILWKLVDLQGSAIEGTCITRECYVPRENNHPSRFVDMVISNVVEYIKATIPALIHIPLEIKPISRQNETFEKLLLQGENQVVGHLAKMLMASLHIGGIGVDSTVRGVIMTMLSIELIQIELSKVGTEHVKLTTKKTGHLPLFDYVTTTAILNDMPVPQCNVILDTLGMPKKEENNREISTQEQTPCMKATPSKGFLLLNFLLSPSTDVERPSNTSAIFSTKKANGETREFVLGTLLGSGAFCFVYDLDDKNSFVKIPKSYRCKGVLENEMEALKDLDSDCIPKLISPGLGTLTVQQACQKSELLCLGLNGLIGTPLSARPVPLQHLSAIILKIKETLLYIHFKGWVHFDVRPSNIVFEVGHNGIRVQLIDFGCAAKARTSMRHFRGCPPYAHSDLLNGKPWKAEGKHDLASLAYSVASLLDGHGIPWYGFTGDRVTKVDLESRDRKTVQILNEHRCRHLSEELADYFITILRGDSTEVHAASHSHVAYKRAKYSNPE